jgi:hypothetical protein
VRLHPQTIAVALWAFTGCTDVGRAPGLPHRPPSEDPKLSGESPIGVSGDAGAGFDGARRDGGSADAGPSQGGSAGLPCTIQVMLASRCLSCHGSPPTNGAPSSLVTYEDLRRTSIANSDADEANESLIRIQDSMSPMPPDSMPRASAAEIYALARWILSGYPYVSDCTQSDDAGDAPRDAGP